MAQDYKKIEEYGIIGNLETCALVGRDGSIDWCCFPHLESPSVLAAILDVERGGRFSISPTGPFASKQSYVKGTNVLQTIFSTLSGSVIVTDFMPVMADAATGNRHRAILRKVSCSGGSAEMEVVFEPRFDYARGVPTLQEVEGGIIARWEDQRVLLQSPSPLRIHAGRAAGTFAVSKGDEHWCVLQHGNSLPISRRDCEDLLRRTTRRWRDWMHSCEPSKCIFDGPWHDLVARSGLVLKLLTHPETGAIAAAPTTSLPEVIGGVRNWDYRFAWIRDASFTVQALHNLGYTQEARDYFRWLRNLCQTCEAYITPSEIQIMYTLHGSPVPEEVELLHLSGYRDSRPIRVGNAAAKQKQLDIYGELVNAFYEIHRYGEDISQGDWSFIQRITDYVGRTWGIEDAGIWEVRGGPRHFTHSKLMCWLALDRSIKIAEKRGFAAPLKEWKRTRAEIRRAILARGFNRRLNSFVQAFDSEVLDATSLLIPILGFLPADDLRVRSTIEATLRHLMVNGLVHRYQGDDGLPGQEGAFVLCTFWLVQALTLSGQIDKAEGLFSGILKYASPLGLFAEEIETGSGEQLGNYPQAFSHIGLINSALYLGRAKGRRPMGPEPIGVTSAQ